MVFLGLVMMPLGWPLLVGIVVAGAIVMVYISLGGLSSAIYNEVLQFFVIVAALLPAANLFDLRRIIGGLFVVYGLLLTCSACSTARRRSTRPRA